MLKIISDLSSHRLTLIIASIIFFALIGAYTVSFFESNKNEEFSALTDAIWWVLVTMTTVGYGDKVPLTTGGRIVGIVIMFFGVALLSLFTATISSVFIA
jgi:voltage-gated potassium channel